MIKKTVLSLVLLFAVFSTGQIMAKEAPTVGQQQRMPGSVTTQGPLDFMKVTSQSEQTGVVDNAQTYTLFSLSALLNSITELVAGNIALAPKSSGFGYSGGLIGNMNSYISALYEYPPARSGDFIRYVAHNAGFPDPVNKVYAAKGFGVTGLQPVFPIWVAIRNIAYLLFAIVFIVIGLMIVLRVKIDPKTVITVQNALPRIIWALIIITFSYPLAGFLIDFMYLAIGFSLYIIQLTGLYPALGQFTQDLSQVNLVGLIGTNFSSVGPQLGNLTGKTLADLLKIANLPSINIAGQNVVTTVIGPLVGAYFSISVAWALISTFIALITSYGTILFEIIVSPIILLGEAIPGRNSFQNWIKDLLANLLVFPLVITMILFGNIIIEQFTKVGASVNPEEVFIPPMIGVPPQSLGALIGFVIIMTIPKSINLLKEWLSVKESKVGEYWKESLPLQGTFKKGMGGVTGALTRFIPI